MKRIDDMTRRLPQLYRDGELLRGGRTTGGVLEVPAVQLEMIDEIAREIQRSHWFDRTYELDHAGMLAGLLDFTPEPWQELDTFRPWVHALRNAMILDGGVTVKAIETFVASYANAFEASVGVDALTQVDQWNDDAESVEKAAINSAPALVENPRVRRFVRFPASGGALEPLSRFTITNRGRNDTTVSFLITGTPRGKEAAPLIANLTTGEALIYTDEVPEGKRLWIQSSAFLPRVSARLENEDVSAKLRSISGLVPGSPVTSAQMAAPARPLTVQRGRNDLWFFPLALFDVVGLDRFLFSMPDLSVTEGRYDASRFDRALFYQQPLMVLHAAWTEETPASFDVRLPAAAMRSGRPAKEAIPRRALLEQSITQGVGLLHAAGVAATVTMERFVEKQPQLDRLRLVMPVRLRDRGTVGADRLVEHGGTFEVTSFDDSTFR